MVLSPSDLTLLLASWEQGPIPLADRQLRLEAGEWLVIISRVDAGPMKEFGKPSKKLRCRAQIQEKFIKDTEKALRAWSLGLLVLTF